MNLKAKKTRFSSIVGGGFSLIEPSGQIGFQVAIIGGSRGITKEIDAQISERIVELINDCGLEIKDKDVE